MEARKGLSAEDFRAVSEYSLEELRVLLAKIASSKGVRAVSEVESDSDSVETSNGGEICAEIPGAVFYDNKTSPDDLALAA